MGIYIQVSQHMGPFLCVLDQLLHRSYFICDALSNSISGSTSGSEKTEESLRKQWKNISKVINFMNHNPICCMFYVVVVFVLYRLVSFLFFVDSQGRHIFPVCA